MVTSDHPLDQAVIKMRMIRFAARLINRVDGWISATRLAEIHHFMYVVGARPEEGMTVEDRQAALVGIASVCDLWLLDLEQRPEELMIAEYNEAKRKHGDCTLDGGGLTDEQRFMALAEEVGEIARACTYDEKDQENLVTEIAQTGALALAWLTRLDKQHDKEGENA